MYSRTLTKTAFVLISLFLLNDGLTMAATRLDNEGVNQGYINAVDCVGDGIDCTRSGITGTITVNAGAATAGGSNTQVQFNDANALAGDGSFIWSKNQNTLSVSRDVGQTGNAIVVSSDTGTTLAVISHDGSAFFQSVQVITPLSVDQGAVGHLTYTKGDLIVATTSKVLTKLPVGTNGQVLSADSAEASGVKWATLPAAGAGSVGGSGTTNQVAYWTSSTNIGGDADLTFNGTTLAGGANLQADFGGITGFIIPQGTAPTVDDPGEIAIDSTQDQLKFFVSDDKAIQVITASHDAVAYIENVSSSDKGIVFFSAARDITVRRVGCRFSGDVATIATFQLTDGTGAGMTHTSPTCVSGDTACTFQSVTAGNTIAAGKGVGFNVTNTPNPSTNDYTLIVEYTVDAK